MKSICLYSFALLSLLNATVDSDKIFTQDTELDSNYSLIKSTPINGEALYWGEVRGGSKDVPITLSTKQPLVISAITHDNGGVGGICISTKSHALLKGDLTFSALSSHDGVIGVFESGFSSLSNEGRLAFGSISSSSGVAIGVNVATLIQKGSLEFGKIDGGLMGMGTWAYQLDNQASGSITLQELTSTNSVMGIGSFVGRNSGSINLKSMQGNEVIGFFSLIFLNEGNITLGDLNSQDSTLALSASVISNLGKINVSSLNSQGTSYGIEAELDNQGEVVFDTISAGSNAVGIYGDVQNYKNITFNAISAKDSAKGVYWGDVTNEQGGIMTFKSISGDNLAVGFDSFSSSVNNGILSFENISSKKMAIGFGGTLYTSKGASTTFGTIQAPKAVGIYQDSFFNEVGGGGSIVFENITGAESYGILIDTRGGLNTANEVNHSVIHFKSIQSNIGIKNLGEMSIQSDTFVFAPTAPAQSNSAIYSDMQNAKFYLNKIDIDTPYEYGFYAKQDAEVYIENAKASFGAKHYSFGGKTHLYLTQNAKLNLDTGGSVKTLNAEGATISLGNGGYSKRLVVENFQAQNSNFMMSVDLESNQDAQYDGGAVYENNTKIQKGLSAFLQIDSSKTTNPTNNTFSIKLNTKTNLTQKYILLAQVSGTNRDNVVFNSLADRQTIAIASSEGYQTSDLLLGRYDDDKTNNNYYYLIANSFEAQDPTKPTPSTPSTPTSPQTPQNKESRNALIYNPIESTMLATLDWSQARFAKLRDETRSGRIWAELGAEYWKFNGGENCNESFVDLIFGGDYLFSFAKGKNALGVAVELTGGFIEQFQILGSEKYPLEIDSMFLSLALYDVLILDNGVYSNLSFRAGGGEGEIKESGAFDETFKDSSLMFYTFSEQVGKRIFFSKESKGAFIDFSATLALGYTEGMTLTKNLNSLPWGDQKFISISADPSFINQNTLEVFVGYRGAFNSFFSFDINAGVGVVSNHRIGGEMQYEDQNGIYDFKGDSYVGGLEFKANAMGRIGDWIDAYVSVGSTWSKQYNEVIDFSAGIKLRFGTV